MTTAVVIGGGISGLTATHFLQKSSKFSKIILLESSKRVGGWVQTEQTDSGAYFEMGPRSIRPLLIQGRTTIHLAEELGLSNDILMVTKSSQAAQKRYIYANGNLNLLPNKPLSMFRKCPPFSKPLILSILKEIKQPAGKENDETVYDFVNRRLGNDIAEYLVDPFCRGIFAGDCRKLSIKSCFPALHTLEQAHGSIIKGALIKKPQQKVKPSQLVSRMADEKCASYSFTRGLQQFTDSLESACQSTSSVQILKNAACAKLDVEGSKMLVTVNDDVIKADHVVSSIFAQDLAKILPPSLTDLSDSLNKIPAVDVVVVGIELEGEVTMPVEGFGHLLPSSENPGVLGVIYDSCTFPAHDSHTKKGTRFTVMMGGAWSRELVEAVPAMDEEGLGKYALDSLLDQLQISATPLRVNVHKLKDCIPQYLVGHSKVLENVFGTISERKLPLSLVGSSYKGPSVNDCIHNTKLEVERVTGCSF